MKSKDLTKNEDSPRTNPISKIKFLATMLSLSIFVIAYLYYPVSKHIQPLSPSNPENELTKFVGEETERPDNYISSSVPNPVISVFHQNKPEILTIENLISDDEADFIIEKSIPKLGLASPFQNRDEAYSPKFFSGLNTFLKKEDYPLVGEIEKRLSKVIDEPIENIEVCRRTRYEYKQFVGNHVDYSPNADYIHEIRGQRHRTVIIYLTTLVEGEGGETYFPLIEKKIHPKKGSASVFRNINKYSKKPDTMSKHASLEVLAIDKEKWVMVFFIKNSIDYDKNK